MIREGLKEAWLLVSNGDPLVFEAALRSLWISLTAVGFAALAGIPLALYCATHSFKGKRIILLLARGAMAFPTAFVGLLCYSLFAKPGLLGGLGLLYTPWAIVCGEFILAFPIVFSLSQGALSSLDPRAQETALTLGAGPLRRLSTLVSEARIGVFLGLLTALARCMTELGIAVLVGGNLLGRTRTLAGSIVLETSRGEYGRGIAMGLLLLVMALGVTSVVALLSLDRKGKDRR